MVYFLPQYLSASNKEANKGEKKPISAVMKLLSSIWKGCCARERDKENGTSYELPRVPSGEALVPLEQASLTDADIQRIGDGLRPKGFEAIERFKKNPDIKKAQITNRKKKSFDELSKIFNQ